jgi:hypothetical protein
MLSKVIYYPYSLNLWSLVKRYESGQLTVKRTPHDYDRHAPIVQAMLLANVPQSPLWIIQRQADVASLEHGDHIFGDIFYRQAQFLCAVEYVTQGGYSQLSAPLQARVLETTYPLYVVSDKTDRDTLMWLFANVGQF